MNDETIKITLTGRNEISAIRIFPANPHALIIIAHGAGAGISHPFMTQIARELHDCNIASIRFNFPYMEQGKKRPDTKNIAVETFMEVIEYVSASTDLPLFIGGKSYGGRMASWHAASLPMDKIRGLIYWGFPLHAPGRPSIDRAEHLYSIPKPMLFLQGTRDALADLILLKPVVTEIPLAELYISEGSDHSFHVLKRSGRNDSEVMKEITNKISDWILSIIKTA